MVGPSENLIPSDSRCRPNSARLSTENARCGKSACTCTGPLAGKEQISINSSLSGAFKNTNSDPRGDFDRRVSSKPRTFL